MQVDIAVDELRRRGFLVERKVERSGTVRLSIAGPEGVTPPYDAIEALRENTDGALDYIASINRREELALDFHNLMHPTSRRHRQAGARSMLRRIVGE